MALGLGHRAYIRRLCARKKGSVVMPKVITYEELNRLLAPILDGKIIKDICYTYIGKVEHVKLRFTDDPDPIKIQKSYGFMCTDCGHKWEEPGQPVNITCPACANENIEALGLRPQEKKPLEKEQA